MWPTSSTSFKEIKMEQKQYLKAYVEKQDDQDGVLQVAIANEETPDREGETIKVAGWDLNNFKKNPVLLWSHNSGFGEQRPPIGRVEDIRVEGKKLLFKPVFDMADSFAAEIFRKFKDGFLNAFSVGFIPLARDVKNELEIEAAELLEISAVNVPAHPKALVSLREAGMPVSKSFEDWKKGFVEYPDEKGAVGRHTTATANLDVSWDGSGARKALLEWAGGKENTNFAKYRRGFAWVDETEPENLSSYKLPHHTIENGELTVVYRGVTAAMAALLGARGGTDIPEEDRKAVYNHLKGHYEQYDREAPEFRFVEEQILKDIEVETVTEFVVLEKKEVLDREALKELIKEALPKNPIKEASKAIHQKTEQEFNSEDLRDVLAITAKGLELSFKKMKTFKGGGEK